MTACDLAKKLEVSERTIYRDVNALSIAGVPIYGESGHGGGIALVENYRTNLTGLNQDELRALFMLGSLTPLADLGVSEELQGALLKLSASLPQDRRQDEDRIRQCFYFDSTWWSQREERVPHLQVVQQAIWQDRKLQISYRTPFSLEIKHIVSPYGLVAKAGKWYLVFARNENINVQKISEFIDVQISEETFERPGDFNLAEYWNNWCIEYEKVLSFFTTTVRVAPNFISILPRYFGTLIHDKIAQAGQPDSEGWITLNLSFESFEAARERILGFGRGMEVLKPIALRRSVLDYAEQITNLYSLS